MKVDIAFRKAPCSSDSKTYSKPWIWLVNLKSNKFRKYNYAPSRILSFHSNLIHKS